MYGGFASSAGGGAMTLIYRVETPRTSAPAAAPGPANDRGAPE